MMLVLIETKVLKNVEIFTQHNLNNQNNLILK
jgi:hypothetical protein